MKKIISRLAVAAVWGGVIFSGCDELSSVWTALSSPVLVGSGVSASGFTISREAAGNAVSYGYILYDGQAESTGRLSVTSDNLKPETSYSIVKFH